MEIKPRTIVMEFLHLGTISYTLDQVSLGNEYFGVQSNGDFYLKTGLTTFSSGQTLSLTATVTDSGGLTGTCYCILLICIRPGSSMTKPVKKCFRIL